MLYGSTPFKGANRHATFSNVLRNEVSFPDHPATTTMCKSVIKKLLWKDEHKRLGSQSGASEVKQAKWFQSIQFALLRHRTPPIVPTVSYVTSLSLLLHILVYSFALFGLARTARDRTRSTSGPSAIPSRSTSRGKARRGFPGQNRRSKASLLLL
jgi:hypothetical protein